MQHTNVLSETMLTQTTKAVYISVCTCVLKLTRPMLLAINRENTAFAIGALMFAKRTTKLSVFGLGSGY